MISEQKSDRRFTLRGKFTSISLIHIYHFETCEGPWPCRTEHGYLTSLHRIRPGKISDKEKRVRKFPTIEMATMLWRHMVIKFDNDPGLVMALLEAWKVTNNGRPLRFYQVKTARNGDFLRLTWKLTDNGSQYGLLQISTLRDFSHKIYSYCWKKLKKHVLSLENGLTTCYLWRHIS